MENKIFKDVPAISESQILTEEMMSQVESGSACEGGCKKTCISNMNGSYGNGSDTVDKALDKAEEIVEDIVTKKS